MGSTVAELLAQTAARDPDGVALVHAGNRITWASLDSRASAFAAGALNRGLRGGGSSVAPARVAIVTAPRSEFVVAHLGALRAGLVSVPLNPALTSHELAQRTHDTRPSLVICDPTTEVAVREALTLNHIGTEVVVPVGSADWGDLVRTDRSAAPSAAPDPEAPAALMFTGGVHARAQAATLSHRAMLGAIDQFGTVDPAPLRADDVLLLSLPLVHAQTLNSVVGLAIAVGATVVIDRRHDPQESIDLLEREGVTVVAADPALLGQWAASPDVGLLEGVRLLAIGQGSVPSAVAQQLLTLTGTPVWEGYGMAEAGGLITCTAGRDGEPGSVGVALPGVELRVVDTDGDDVDDDGDPGEVVVRSASLFSGYWPDGRGRPDPWLATDDVAYVDESGGLHLVDRRHDMIVVSGFPVFPREVEEALASMPGVAECAVVGVEHPATGQAVVALVVAAPGARPEPEAVVAHCAGLLARHKCPTIVRLVDELPHTESGAVQRHLLQGH